MMQLARRVSLVVVLLLLASVGTACAECAWLLLEGQVRKKTALPLADAESFVFKRHAAFPNFEECSSYGKAQAENAARLVTAMSEGKRSAKASGSGGVWEVEEVFTTSSGAKVDLGSVSRSFRCFPDTVDPRGPKAR